MSDINGMYGRTNADGNISVWSAATGAPVTFMPADVKPVGSELSARKNHPKGIVLTRADALAIGLEIRGAAPPASKPAKAVKPLPPAKPDPTGQTFKAEAKPASRSVFDDPTLRHDRGHHGGPPNKANR